MRGGDSLGRARGSVQELPGRSVGVPTGEGCDMRIFVAGATGAMGVPLVKRLVAAGHQVTGLTRSESKRPLLESLGATVAVADVFEAGRLGTVLREARPEVVVHLLTALP